MSKPDPMLQDSATWTAKTVNRPNILDPSILGRTIGSPDTSRILLPKSAFSYIKPGELRGNLGMNTFRKGTDSKY